MGLSKSHRIMVLLAIDTVFFLLEIIIGYSVHSLALVADSFHMLNDVLSLCVGLWAVKVANQTTNSKMYTYGWQRAETLGALVNGVFLVALCLSIFLEAIQRFAEPQEISNPQLVFIVGCLGLASNILGLFLFHDHGHSHGGHGHSHGRTDEMNSAEEGRSRPKKTGAATRSDIIADENGDVEDVLPRVAFAGSLSQESTSEVNSRTRRRQSFSTKISRDDSLRVNETVSSGAALKNGSPSNTGRRNRRHTSGSRSRHTSVDDLQVHPASFRHDIIAASRLEDIESSPNTESEGASSCDEPEVSSEVSPLLGQRKRSDQASAVKEPPIRKSSELLHSGHNHRQPKSSGGRATGHSHSHGDLNMRGVFLHVMGDALGNIGVIATALFIWLTDFSWRFYSDPLISLLITIIILCSAIPLCRAASRILLQAVPIGISIDDIKEDIEDLAGVVSCHHLHVWQLSDTKLVASLHVQVAFDYKAADSEQYMALARAVRTCLHEYGIHSSTIQPEFCLDLTHHHTPTKHSANEGFNGSILSADRPSRINSGADGRRSTSTQSLRDACLLDCDDICGTSKGCCAPSTAQDGGGDGAQ